MNYSIGKEKDDKKKGIQEFEKAQMRLYKNGRLYVWIFSIVHIIFLIIYCIFEPNAILPSIIDVTLIVGFIFGHETVRFLFALMTASRALSSFNLMLEFYSINKGISIFFAIMTVYNIVFCKLLFSSKSISEYLYINRYG